MSEELREATWKEAVRVVGPEAPAREKSYHGLRDPG